MTKAPMVAILINKNSENTSPFLMLSNASLITGNPTGAYATTYQTILTQPVNQDCGTQLSKAMAIINNTKLMIAGKNI